MKIFVDCRWYSQPGQGVVTYLACLHRVAEASLAASGRADLEFWYGVEDAGAIDASLLPPNARVLSLGRRGMLWRLLVLPFVLRRQGFEVAHFQYVCPLLRLGTRYVVSIHDVLFLEYPEFFHWRYRWPRQVLFRLSSAIADEVITISQQSSRAIQRFLAPRHAPVIIPLGSGLREDAAAPVEPIAALAGRPFLLTVGRIEPRKNFPRLARAFAAAGLPESGATMVVAGACSPEFRSELERFRDAPGVLWLDRVSDAQLAWLYRHTKGFVFPSLGEGFGIPVIEAIAADLPVAVSNTLPLPDVVEAIDASFDPRDDAQMAAALRRLWDRPTLAAGKATLLDRYSWRAAAEGYLAILRRMAGAAARRAAR